MRDHDGVITTPGAVPRAAPPKSAGAVLSRSTLAYDCALPRRLRQAPSWGQTAEGAWGGVGQPKGQGILTRPFVSGGFTWTGWDCARFPPAHWSSQVVRATHQSSLSRADPFAFAFAVPTVADKGEPTPYQWPDVNSHFGILDIAGFPKDRFYWYKAWFLDDGTHPSVHLFPHWNWARWWRPVGGSIARGLE